MDAPDLAPHPWSDETMVELAKKYTRISHGWTGDPAREFMREMIQRYGTCAMLAWDQTKVVGQLRFYPMKIARLIAVSQSHSGPILDCTVACSPEEDEGTLWVQCVMTCGAYVDSQSAKEVGARKGVGQKLVHALICWARENDWKRIVKIAHCDLDWFYGVLGGGGKAFWEKAGFQAVGAFYKRAFDLSEKDKSIVQSQMMEKSMSEEDVWTWHRMVYDL